MNVIRTLKLAGYTLKSEHLPVKLEDLPVKLEPYDDPFDVPMSPLTVLSDDGDDDIVPLSMTALPPGAMKRSRSPELQTGDIFADESPAPPAEASTLPPSDSVGALLPGAQSPSSSPVYQAHSTIRAVRPSTRGIKSEAKARQTREPQLRARPPVATTERQLRARPSAPADSPSAIRSASDRGKQPEGQNLPQRQLRSRPSMTSAIVSTPSLQERLAPPEKRRQIGVDRSAHVLQNTMSVPSPSAPLTAPKPVAMSDTGAQEQAPIHPSRPDAPAAVSGTGLQEGPIPPPKRKRGRPPAVRRPDPVLQDTSSLPPSGPLTAPEAVAMADAGAEEWGPIHPAHPVAPPAVPVAGLQEGPIPPPKRKPGRPPAVRRLDPVLQDTLTLPRGLALTRALPQPIPVAPAVVPLLEAPETQLPDRPSAADGPAPIEQGMLKLPPSGRPELVAISDAADKRPREQHCTVGCVEPTGRRAIKYREHCKCSDPRKADIDVLILYFLPPFLLLLPLYHLNR
ncbi:hypothetical protein C8R43DRAFT_676019 [Mycena crocata]|nr:hypothetical protein C8R43DRAFT_676019 [Mycena crocata]